MLGFEFRSSWWILRFPFIYFIGLFFRFFSWMIIQKITFFDLLVIILIINFSLLWWILLQFFIIRRFSRPSRRWSFIFMYSEFGRWRILICIIRVIIRLWFLLFSFIRSFWRDRSWQRCFNYFWSSRGRFRSNSKPLFHWFNWF